jgi:uncharacterized protein with PIN domain
MSLSKNELNALMRLVGLTKESEINCEQCLSLVAEFAERELAGKSIPESVRAVEHHLNVCAECREEYEVLQQVLKEMEG